MRGRPTGELFDHRDRLVKIGPRGHRVRHVRHVGADVDADDVGALLGEADGVAAPLPTTHAGDEGDLAFKTSWHVCPPTLPDPRSTRAAPKQSTDSTAYEQYFRPRIRNPTYT